MSKKPITIHTDHNPYRDEVQGLANQPPTVVKLLANARERLGLALKVPSQADVCDRLVADAPRVAIISGSADQLAHITDDQTIARTAVAVWEHGGVPFNFGIPVMCDGTAQAHMGMTYSLFTRNLAAELVANQMESHAYHSAIVLQGCDKTPFGIACGLTAVDRVRMHRGEPPVWATFVPVHVMAGGTLPAATRTKLEAVARRAEGAGQVDAAEDLRATMEYVVQCTTTQAYDGVFQRLLAKSVLTTSELADLRRRLATCANDANGGICAFNGTGNSSRVAMAALGLAHPAVEFLSAPPSAERVESAVGDLFKLFNNPVFSVSRVARENWANAVRVYSATGGSTNLILHLIALANYAGMRTTIETYDQTRRATPVPDLFDFSLTEKRTHYELARQCERAQIRGVETIYYELLRQDVPLNLQAPTVTGDSWATRLKRKEHLSAAGVKSNPIVLTKPRRLVSGVDVLTGNFFDSAVLKVSGMDDDQLEAFDDKVHFVFYFDNEEVAKTVLLDPHVVEQFFRVARLSKKALLTMLLYNVPDLAEQHEVVRRPVKDLYSTMVSVGALKIAAVIAGQGPIAFGMPEMFAPMQFINSNRRLRKITTLISDGRYSGVSYGAAIGHLTPEAAASGGIIYLKHGDVLRLRLKKRTLDLMDPSAFAQGRLRKLTRFRTAERKTLAARRLAEIAKRRTRIAALCLQDVTGASTGVIPRRLLADDMGRA